MPKKVADKPARENREYAVDISEGNSRVFKYKGRKRLLEPTDQTFGQIRALAARMMTQEEIAAILQTSLSNLKIFFREHPESKEAWEEGKEIGRARLRALLWEQAKEDPAQARFLAKQQDWLGYDEKSGSGNLTVNINSIPKEERIKRVQELQSKLIDKGAEDLEVIAPSKK